MVCNSVFERTGYTLSLRLRSHGNDIVPLSYSYQSDFWNGKVDCSQGSILSVIVPVLDLFTRVRYRIVPQHFAPKQAKENLTCQQISNTAE